MMGHRLNGLKGRDLRIFDKKKALLGPLFGAFAALPARACELALVLAVDVSGSVDPDEFRIQLDGVAEALMDGAVSEALVRGQSQIMLMQWSGGSRQRVSIPWRQIRTFDDVDRLADDVRDVGRAWRNFSTAIGEALEVAHGALGGTDCARRVIDVSGDGESNEGIPPNEMHDALAAQSTTVNALVIEGEGTDLTAWFWENVITGEGAFVVTANGYLEYPQAIRRKLLREVVEQVSALSPSIRDHENKSVITQARKIVSVGP